MQGSTRWPDSKMMNMTSWKWLLGSGFQHAWWCLTAEFATHLRHYQTCLHGFWPFLSFFFCEKGKGGLGGRGSKICVETPKHYFEKTIIRTTKFCEHLTSPNPFFWPHWTTVKCSPHPTRIQCWFVGRGLARRGNSVRTARRLHLNTA